MDTKLGNLISNYIDGLHEDDKNKLPEKITLIVNKNKKTLNSNNELQNDGDFSKEHTLNTLNKEHTLNTESNKEKYIKESMIKEYIDKEIRHILDNSPEYNDNGKSKNKGKKGKDIRDYDDDDNRDRRYYRDRRCINIIEGYTDNSSGNKLHDTIEIYLKHNNNDTETGLKLLNICNKTHYNDSIVNNLKKKCLHGNNIWGTIINNNGEHIGYIELNGKMSYINDSIIEQTNQNNIYLRKNHNSNINNNSHNNYNHNIIGQIIDNNNKAIAIIVNSDDKKYITLINEQNIIQGIPIYGIKKN